MMSIIDLKAFIEDLKTSSILNPIAMIRKGKQKLLNF